MIENKYSKWYFNIIENRKLLGIPDEYSEKHHIIPKSLGGSNNDDNLISLTGREHFLVHWLLVKMTTGSEKIKMQHALWGMSGNGRSLSSIA